MNISLIRGRSGRVASGGELSLADVRDEDQPLRQSFVSLSNLPKVNC